MEKNESYHTIKELMLGKTQVKVCIESIPTENQVKSRLIKIYDLINEIAQNAEKRGIDTSKWFYTQKQICQLKKKPENKFI